MSLVSYQAAALLIHRVSEWSRKAALLLLSVRLWSFRDSLGKWRLSGLESCMKTCTVIYLNGCGYNCNDNPNQSDLSRLGVVGSRKKLVVGFAQSGLSGGQRRGKQSQRTHLHRGQILVLDSGETPWTTKHREFNLDKLSILQLTRSAS